MPSLLHLSTQADMQLQSESTQLALQMRTVALARAGALANALAQARLAQALAARALEQERVQERVLAARAVALEQARARGRAARAVAQEQALGRGRGRGRVVAQELALARGRGLAARGRGRGREQEYAKAEARMFPYSEALADSKLMDIIYSIKLECRHRLAHDLWHHSEYWWLIQIIVPITRIPQELLHRILLISISDASDSPFVLMRVSKLWHSTVTGIWASLKLGTTTPRDAVTRRNQLLLDVVIDTEFDRDHFTPSEGPYQAIFAAIQAASRWRTLVVETFPAQTDLPEDLVNGGLQQSSDVAMSCLRSFRIKFPCEASSLLQRLLCILGTATNGELTTVEINSASVISFLAPTHPSIFHSVKDLYLDIPQLPNPVDILPHLHRLEAFNASHLSLPIYHNDVDIPFVHTLRHLTLSTVSIQWMSGRTFHVLESCTLLFPLPHHVLQTFSTTLPNCNDLTFQGHALNILHGVSTQNLTHLTVKCSHNEKPRGSQELVQFSSRGLREHRLAPRILHISIEATNQAWIKAFPFMSNLEELVIDNAHPSSLGVKALQALVVHPVHANNMGTTVTPGGLYTPVCPLLKRFGLRYRRWLRPSEHFDLIPELVSIVLSRQQSKFSLQNVHIWRGSEEKDPLELIDGSGISLEGFERLSNVKGRDLLRLVACRLVENMGARRAIGDKESL